MSFGSAFCRRLLSWLILPLLIWLAAAFPAPAQVINTGTLFITSDETVFIDDDFIEADTSNTTNQGRLIITGTMQFLTGVVDEVGGFLTGGWFGQSGFLVELPNFHTIFLSEALSLGAAAIAEGGAYNGFIDGPVRRSGGQDFIFPTGDVRDGMAFRGLVGMSGQAGPADLDVQYFWRDGHVDFGTALKPMLAAVSDTEYWRVWGQHPVTLSPMYENTSEIASLVESVPGETLADLTLAGWNGAQWVDLDGTPGPMVTDLSGVVQARLQAPREFLAITFGIRITDEDSDGDGVPNDKEWDVDGDGQGLDDSDGDGTPDYLDTDDDDDGYLTADEDWDGTGTPCDDDSNGDGTPDYLDPNAPNKLRLWVKKTASENMVGFADPVVWRISVENKSDVPISATLVDTLPLGFAFSREKLEEETGGIVGLPPGANESDFTHPAMRKTGIFIHWPDLLLTPGEVRVIEFLTETTIGLDPGVHTNQAFAVGGNRSGRFFSNLAEQEIELEQDQQLECSTVIGRVFDDLNADGYYDPGEPGLAKTRIGEHSGLFITTDDHGRFHLPCELVKEDYGKNLVLKLDVRTLPEGYKVTSENPRAIRVTRGKMTKVYFAATKQREVQLDINDCSFMIPSDAPIQDSSLAVLNPIWEQSLNQLVGVLEERPARLVISYTGGPTMTNLLIQSRVRQAENAIMSNWKSKRRAYRLRSTTKVQRYIKKEAPPCEPSFLEGIVGLGVIDRLPENTRPLTPDELEELHLEPGFTAVRAPDGRLFLLETEGALGSSPTKRSDYALPPSSRRIDDPAGFGLRSVPVGLVPYLTPGGAIRLIKPVGVTPSFVPASTNPG